MSATGSASLSDTTSATASPTTSATASAIVSATANTTDSATDSANASATVSATSSATDRATALSCVVGLHCVVILMPTLMALWELFGIAKTIPLLMRGNLRETETYSIERLSNDIILVRFGVFIPI